MSEDDFFGQLPPSRSCALTWSAVMLSRAPKRPPARPNSGAAPTPAMGDHLLAPCVARLLRKESACVERNQRANQHA